MSNRFVEAYLVYQQEELGPSFHGDVEDEAAEAWAASQRLHRTDDEHWLRRLVEIAPRETQWQLIPQELYRSFTWDELNVPLMRLVGPRNRLLNSIATEALQHGSWPFGLDVGDGGFYVADVSLGSLGAVWWSPNGTWDRAARKGPLASSMEQALDVVALLMTTSGGRASVSDALIVPEVQAIDPVMARSWNDWWTVQLAPPPA